MNIITSVPIINEKVSNAQGKMPCRCSRGVRGYCGESVSCKDCCANLSDSFDGYSYFGKKSNKNQLKKEPRNGFFSSERRADRKKKREANKKPKNNAKKLIEKKDNSGLVKFYYPLTLLFSKEGKWFKKHPDGSTAEVKSENVLKSDPTFRFFNTKSSSSTEPIAVDKIEVTKATGSGAINWQSALAQGMERVKEAQSLGMLPIPVLDENVTITDQGAYVNEEIQDKNTPAQDVKNDEKNKLTSNQNYLIWGIVVVAVGVIGFAIYKYVSKGKAN